MKDADQSDASVLLYQEHARAFEGIAASHQSDVNIAPTSANERVERVAGAQTSANLFDVLRVPPMLGRGFRTGEDRGGAPPVAILSYQLWQRRFHGDRSVIGQRMIEDGVSRQIVGVMPRGFAYPSPSVEVWIPSAFDPETLGVLLDEVLQKYRVDADRVYLTGNSMGGTGTWALAADRPDHLAAIAPICGAGDPASSRLCLSPLMGLDPSPYRRLAGHFPGQAPQPALGVARCSDHLVLQAHFV